MINSAALWPLLEPQWKDPKKWWKELADRQGQEGLRLVPPGHALLADPRGRQVPRKTRPSASPTAASGATTPPAPGPGSCACRTRSAPDFRIEEAPYRGDGGHEAHRAAYLAEHPEEALAAIEKEALRRRRKQKQPQPELRILEPGLWTTHPEDCWQPGADAHRQARRGLPPARPRRTRGPRRLRAGQPQAGRRARGIVVYA